MDNKLATLAYALSLTLTAASHEEVQHVRGSMTGMSGAIEPEMSRDKM